MSHAGRWIASTGLLALAGCVEIDPRFYVGGCGNIPEDAVFCTDFEEGDLEAWADYDENPAEMNDIVADPGPFDLHGNHVVRMRPPPGPGGVDLVGLLPGYYDALYARWYVRLEPGYDLDAATALWPGFHAGSRDTLGTSDTRPSGADRFTVLLSHDAASHQLVAKLDYPGMYQDCSEPAGMCFRDELPCLRDQGESFCTRPADRSVITPIALVKERWYCVELFVDGGTPTPSDAGADGRIAMWLDGSPVAAFGDLWLRSDPNLQIGILYMIEYTSGEHGHEGVLYDDVVVGPSRIGCGRGS